MDIASTNNDCALFSRIASNSEEAYSTVFRRYSKRIFDAAYMYLQDDAPSADIVQEVFLKLWEKRAMLDSIESPENYLFILARNCVYDHLRKQARRELLHKGYGINHSRHTNNTEDWVLEKQYALMLSNAVDTLPPRRKTIFLLAKVQGLSYDQISEKLHISRFTVKNQMVQALQSLRTFFNEHLHGLFFLLFFLASIH